MLKPVIQVSSGYCRPESQLRLVPTMDFASTAEEFSGGITVVPMHESSQKEILFQRPCPEFTGNDSIRLLVVATGPTMIQFRCISHPQNCPAQPSSCIR